MRITLEQQKANRKLWVEALRSGKYGQAKSKLQDGGRFCCLGLACLVAGKTVAMMGNHPNLSSFADVRDFYGLSDELGSFNDGGIIAPCLASKNDDGKTFAEIADIIAAEPPGLFVESVTP